MRRVWAATLSVWALLGLVAVMAWSRPPAQVVQPQVRTVVVRTAHGTRRVAVLMPATHATTQTSPGAVRQPAVVPGQGSSVVSPGAGGGNN